MFDRFSDNAKHAMNRARQEAMRLGRDTLDAEHILLGLLRVEQCTALRVLDAVGCEPAGIRARVESSTKVKPPDTGTGQLPFTRRGKRVLERAMEQAGDIGDTYIGTEHLLLGLVVTLEDEPEAVRTEILGVSSTELRSALWRLRGESPREEPTTIPRPRGPSAEKITAVATLCIGIRDELVHQGRFEQASRLRDIAHQLTVLAREVSEGDQADR